MPNPGKNRKNDQYERLERRKKVAHLYLTGATQWEIAGLVKVSQGTVSNDLAAIRVEWLESTLRDFDDAKAQELAKLDHLEREAWAAWERSCREAETNHERIESALASPFKAKKLKVKEQARLEVVRRIQERTTRKQVGDPRFLERVAWCIESRLKILLEQKIGEVEQRLNKLDATHVNGRLLG